MEYQIKDGLVYDEDGVAQVAVAVRISKHKTAEGKEFYAFKAVNNNKHLVDLSFRMGVTQPDVPRVGLYILVFGIGKPEDFYNIATNRIYPRMYVGAYDALIPFDKDFKHTLKLL